MAVYAGTIGNDTLTGSTAADSMTGVDGNDILYGGTGNDSIYGGNGNDSLTGGAGSDILDGGAGTDTVDYSASTLAVTVTINGSTNTGGDAAGDVLTAIENLIGSALNDSLTGSTANNVISGGNGNDTILGGAGDDSLFGGAGNDVIQGGSGNDSLDGGTGVDTLDYSASTAAVFVTLNATGGLGGDAVGDITTGFENLTGSVYNDSLTGDAGANLLQGGSGNDTLTGGSGSDTLDGGAGSDLVSYEASLAAVSIVVGGGAGTGGDAAGDVLLNIETLTGSAFNDYLGGDSAANVLYGKAGNDTIYGGAGNDSLYGEAGDDFFGLETGNDRIDGGDGVDTFNASAATSAVSIDLSLGTFTSSAWGSDTLVSIENLVGSAFNDTLIGDASDNVLTGGAGSDVLTGGAGRDTAIYSASSAAVLINLALGTASGGDAAGDVLTGIENIAGTAFADSLVGGTEDNLFISGGGADTLIGGGGADTVSFAGLAAGVTINLSLNSASGGDLTGSYIRDFTHVIGSDYDDTLTGTTLGNLMMGGLGNDRIYGGEGVDTMMGGAGNDIYRTDRVDDVIIEYAGEGTDLVLSGVDWTLGDNLENLTLEGSSAITGNGNALNNVIIGNTYTGAFFLAGYGNNILRGYDGDDTLFGYGGNDTLDGGTGSDSMVGGTGSDLYIVDSLGDTVLEFTGEGVDTISSSVTYALGSLYIENLTLSGLAAINGTGNIGANLMLGNEADNALYGLAGNDTINSGGGNDTLDGGTGADSMSGGMGNDVYIIDDINDRVIELASSGVDTVLSSVSLTLASYVENLTLTGSGVINGTGNGLDNVILGNEANNNLYGGAGNDSISGGLGNDLLDGGLGNDVMSGGAGNDTYTVDSESDFIMELTGAGTDSVMSSVNWTLGDNVENLTLTGGTGLSGTGNAVENMILGTTASNLLSGMAGNDTLFGYAGNDTLDGGTGNDSMVGGTGNDVYLVDSLGDTVLELTGEGVDTINSSVTYALGSLYIENLTLSGLAAINGTGNIGANLMLGNASHNALYGIEGNDTISSGDGNDTLDGGLGVDSMIGGLGNDVYFVDDINDKVIELANEGVDTVMSSISLTLAGFVENLTLTGTAAINGTGNLLDNLITGNEADNALYGGTGNDSVYGGAGNDTLDGGLGNDVMQGGAGNDTYIVNSETDVVTELSGAGTDTVLASANWTLANNVENLTLTGLLAISGTGNSIGNLILGNNATNLLSGQAGDDTLIGYAGQDTLSGGTGNDSMVGGIGSDLYLVDSLGDTVVELTGEGIDTVKTTITYALSSLYVENLTLAGSAAIDGTGNSGANFLQGNGANNALYGLEGNDTISSGDGNDTLDGGIGADKMTGGQGNDLYIVDSISDKVIEQASGGIDTVMSSITLTLVNNVENLTLTGTSAINGNGNTLNNVITGNDAENALYGGAGHDWIAGGLGADKLYGGTGNDTMIGGDGDDYLSATSGQNLFFGGSGNDTISGGSDNDIIYADSGDNRISGGNGNDTIVAGVGKDQMTGGLGADVFVFETAVSIGSGATRDVITDFAHGLDRIDLTGLNSVFNATAVLTGGGQASFYYDQLGSQLIGDVDGNGSADWALGLTGAPVVTATDFLL